MDWTAKIIRTIFGNKCFTYLPNRRLDLFLKGKHMENVNAVENWLGFSEAFDWLLRMDFITTLRAKDGFIEKSYFDSHDLFTTYAKKEYENCLLYTSPSPRDS